MGACNCCDQPICDTPILICDSISVSKTKCGFQDANLPNKVFTTLDFTEDVTTSSGTTAHSTCTGTYNSSCIVTASGQSNINGAFFCSCNNICGGGLFCSCSRIGQYAPPYNYHFVTTVSGNTVTKTYNVYVDPSGTSQEHGTQVYAYSNEYTTTTLKSNTLAALPAYPGIFAGTCSAFASLSTNETSYSIRRTKYKVRHYPTASCYLKVWIRTRFRPVGTTGASDVLTDVATPYEWTGGGTNPCLTDNTKPYNDALNRIDSPVQGTENEPTTNGTTTIEIK